MLVVRALFVAQRSIASDIFATLERGLLYRLDFVAGITRIEFIHHVFQNDQHFIVLVHGIHAVVECDEPAAEAWKNEIRISASLDVISPQPTEILGQNQVDLSIRRVLHQPIEARSIERCPGNAIVAVVVVEIPSLLSDIPGQQFLLRVIV